MYEKVASNLLFGIPDGNKKRQSNKLKFDALCVQYTVGLILFVKVTLRNLFISDAFGNVNTLLVFNVKNILPELALIAPFSTKESILLILIVHTDGWPTQVYPGTTWQLEHAIYKRFPWSQV